MKDLAKSLLYLWLAFGIVQGVVEICDGDFECRVWGDCVRKDYNFFSNFCFKGPLLGRCCYTNKGLLNYEKMAVSAETIKKVCGKNTYHGVPLIYGGSMSIYPEKWPWMASYYFTHSQVCGGVLISSSHILTAAHCIDNTYYEFMHIKMGSTSSIKLQLYQKYWIQNILVHPMYSSKKLDHDIAIIHIHPHVEFSATIRPICLSDQKVNFENQTGMTIGFGFTHRFDIMGSFLLKEVQAPILTNKECKTLFSKANINAPLTENMICAGGYKPESPCNGDSGGPLMAEIKGIWHLVGLTSFGTKCGRINHPIVFVRISSYLRWIRGHTGLL